MLCITVLRVCFVFCLGPKDCLENQTNLDCFPLPPLQLFGLILQMTFVWTYFASTWSHLESGTCETAQYCSEEFKYI